MKERILKIIQHEKLTPSRFADIIGVQRSNVSHVFSGRSNPSLDFLSKILNHFPNISGDWLITGNGNMLKSGGVISNSLFDAPKHLPVEKQVIVDSHDISSDKPPISLNMPNEPEHDIIESKIEALPTQNEAASSSGLIMPDLFSSGDIEQIVVFYKNRTFVAYKPEK